MKVEERHRTEAEELSRSIAYALCNKVSGECTLAEGLPQEAANEALDIVAKALAEAEARGAREEREACAKVAVSTVHAPPYSLSNSEYSSGYLDAGEAIAAAIRNREAKE